MKKNRTILFAVKDMLSVMIYKIHNFNISKLIILSFLLISFNNFCNIDNQIDFKGKLHFPNSINPNDTNFSDLMFLEEVLKDVNIVCLGEQSHGDGSTFEAKVRLIKFLHQQMGFNVLMFENNIYSTYELNKKIRNNRSIDYDKYLLWLWSKSKQVIPLFKYIENESKSDTPMQISGFDICYGKLNESITKSFESFLSVNNPFPAIDIEEFSKLLNQLISDINSMSIEDAATLRNYFNQISITIFNDDNFLRNKDNSDYLYLYQCFHNLNYLVNFKISSGRNTIPFSSIRDSLMSDNFHYLQNNLHPNEKIIVWAATAHLLRNSRLIDFPGYKQDNVKRMVEHLQDYNYDNLYVLAFTSAKGSALNFKTKIITHLEPPTKGSIEDLLLSTHKEYIFLDFKDEYLDSLFSKDMFSKSLGNIENKGDWTRMVDGIFYIETQKPSIIIE